mmetsp:Transcript_125569/g.187529  ORF Transcript_125569/g.187529 Transcript_125569/m.187529 type:complete len:272 (-) Transcript_125569:34-849(-)
MGLFLFAMSEEPETPKVFPGHALGEEQPIIPTVPEAVLRKKKSLETYKINKEARLLELQKEKEKKRNKRIEFKRAEQIVKNFRKTSKAAKRSNRLSHDGKELRIEPNVKLVLLVRVRGYADRDIDERSQKILNSFRLTKINFARLVQLNEFTKKMIRVIEPYITYGYPTKKTVKDLVYKRGMVIVNGELTSISSNELIEEHLGKYNIICLEDIIHELFDNGEHFKEVNNFLCPFKLSPPKLIEGTRKVLVKETPKTGNRKEEINEFVQGMN